MLGLTIPDGSLPTIPDEWLYKSDNPHMNGMVDDLHVTLKYGLIAPVSIIEVQEVLSGHYLPLQIDTMPVARQFGQSGAPYRAIAYAVFAPELDLINQSLSTLPHIDTFHEYQPHMTVAYVKEEYAHAAIGLLPSRLERLYIKGYKFSGDIFEL